MLFGTAGSDNNTFLAQADTDGNVQLVTILGESSFDKVAAIYPGVDGTMLFGSVKDPDRAVFFSGLDSNGKLSLCSLPNSTANPIQVPFGKLSVKLLQMTERTLSLQTAISNIQSIALKKRATRFCP